MVEGTPLLREHAPKKCIEGSNPSLSASLPARCGPHPVDCCRAAGRLRPGRNCEVDYFADIAQMCPMPTAVPAPAASDVYISVMLFPFPVAMGQ